ncbi:TPA: phage tail protein [Stenotrophomonas maltophilia]|uniref:phage tail protein n=1 Tax=Stenotrophomonas maltophilia TaxID=40324 RepID=UPI0015DFF184|nr:phage tail protein [Stenotrophomonas maltophilia]MBA0448769.1 phage tail protein [Stenotrophomonas maltophilia]HEL2980098.1 phage tail protein [Stenotrophomonas maltophilia]
MALKLPKGTQFGFAPVVSTAIATSAISKAAPALASVAANSVDTGDVVVIELPGWPALNNRATRAGAEATGSVELLGIDTTDTVLFPGNSGAGVLRKAGAFVDLDQQGDPTTAGGEQQYWSGTLLEDPTGRQVQMPTFKNAKTITLPLFYDPKKPWYSALKNVDAKGEPVILRAKLVGGDVLYWYGYLSYNGDPTMAANTPMGTTATFTALADSILVEDV